MPVGDGMGATQAGCAVRSDTRAAGRPPIKTVPDALLISPGPAGTHGGGPVQGIVWSVARAAGMFPIRTVGWPGLSSANGTAGCGTGVGTGAAGWIGAWQCGASCKT